ncbi:MAG: VWA domain-containing protein [Planctomycetes bacterium]|nr:VWA domain-containing protein [Planctomycetota bacterium]
MSNSDLGEIEGWARRQLHLLYLLDVSGSMGELGKLAALNDAMRTVQKMLRDEASRTDRQHAQMLVRVITFSTGARWHLQAPTPIEEFQEWESPEANGFTDLGQALELLAEAMKNDMPRRILPPCVVLISDGQPTDNWQDGMAALKQWQGFDKIVRVAIALGDDADKGVLAEFTGSMASVLPAHNREELISLLKWASSTITSIASVGLPGSHSTQVGVTGETETVSSVLSNFPPLSSVESTGVDEHGPEGAADDTWW